jgi:hypothetical protein
MTLAVCAAVYFAMLLHHPEPESGTRQIAFFSECTCLFPAADRIVQDYRLDGWSCERHAWEPLDPRAYFPIQGDDKESRFARVAYFYSTNRLVMRALAEFVMTRHPSVADGYTGAIGGVRVSRLERAMPEPGDPIARYHFDPLGPPALEDDRKELYYTSIRERRQRCTAAP